MDHRNDRGAGRVCVEVEILRFAQDDKLNLA
jgi:hypothetical protein